MTVHYCWDAASEVDWCSPQSRNESRHYQETVVFQDYIEPAKQRELTNNKDMAVTILL